jgi:hypothetical protein
VGVRDVGSYVLTNLISLRRMIALIKDFSEGSKNGGAFIVNGFSGSWSVCPLLPTRSVLIMFHWNPSSHHMVYVKVTLFLRTYFSLSLMGCLSCCNRRFRGEACMNFV